MTQLTGMYETITNSMLLSDIWQFQNLQVFGETGILIARNRVRYEFGNWVSGYKAQKFILVENGGASQSEIETEKYAVDYTEGILTFDPSWRDLSLNDVIRGYYSFRYFSNDDIIRYINQTKSEMDLLKSARDYDTLADIPTEWQFMISLGTYCKMLRKIAFDQLVWKNRFIFGDFSITQGMITSALQNAVADFNYYREVLKTRRGRLQIHTIMDYPMKWTNIPASDGTLTFVGKYIV